MTVQEKIDFIANYKKASNAANGSQVDANANVTEKNIATLSAELGKADNIALQRAVMCEYLTKLYGPEMAQQYEEDLKHHIIYRHDETSGAGGFPYCVAASLYPFLLNGLKNVGGSSEAPKHTESYIGGLCNLIFIIAAQFVGACLYKDQRLLIRHDNKIFSITAKDFINIFNPQTPYPGQINWLYGDVNNYEVYENNRWVKIKHVFKRQYTDKIYKINTVNNRPVYVSKDHKFKILDRGELKDVPANKLQLGDTLIDTQQGLNIDKTNEDYKLGQFIGIIAGDGCVQENEITVSVNYNEKFIEDFLKERFFTLFNKEMKIRDGHHCDCAYICSREAVAFVNKFFPFGNRAATKGLDLSQNYSMDFLAGYIDGISATDGTPSGSLRIEVTSEKIIDNIVDIFNRFNGEQLIKTVHDDPRENRQRLYKVFIPKKYFKILDLTLKHPTHKKYIDYDPIKSKHKEVSYFGPRYGKLSHTSKPYILKSDCHSKILYDTDAITSIEVFDNDDNYVYEIETESHYYSINGYLTHNCAMPETLTYMDHFLRIDYGENYTEHLDDVIEHRISGDLRLRDRIESWFGQLIYTINQPAAARGNQSIFFNIAYFDKYYFASIFENFVFPDGDLPCWNTTKELQKLFMKWFNNERLKSILTFPVETANILVDKETHQYKDEEMAQFFAEMWAEGASFFMYQSDSVDSLSSCCRLRNAVEKTPFSYTLGAGGVETGSKAVITLNLNRIVQDWDRDENITISFSDYLKQIVQRVHKYLTAFNDKLWDDYNAGLLTIFKAGYIDLDKQYLTVGVNGFLEAAEYLGIHTVPEDEQYRQFSHDSLAVIEQCNKDERTEHTRFNMEFVPAENAAVKFYNWDKRDGYKVPAGRNCYNSYFYPVEAAINPVERFFYQGTGFADLCSGGVALHNNLDEHLTAGTYRKLMDVAVQAGCNYFTYNIKNTICNNCGYISKHTLDKCPKCGSTDLDYATRIVGYLKRVSNFSEARQTEEHIRAYTEPKK